MKPAHLLCAAVTLIAALLPTGLHGQSERLTPERLVTMAQPATPVISPDGKKVAYTVRRADLAKSRWITQVYLVDTFEKVPRQLTRSTQSCTAPAWSPDGRTLTFLSGRQFHDSTFRSHSDTVQLFALPMDGGDAEPWTMMENDVTEYVWSPDGGMVAFLTEEALVDTPPTVKEEKKDWISSADPKPGKDLWILDVPSRSVRKVKTLDRGVTELSWSPDSRRLVYQSNISGEYNDEQKFDLWTIDLSGAQKQLTRAAGPETRPRYSPDGRRIAFISQTVPDIEFAKTEISVVDAAGTGTKVLTSGFPYSVVEFAWAPDGSSLFAVVNERTSKHLYRIGAADGKAIRIGSGEHVLRDLTVSRSGTVACLHQSSITLNEVAVLIRGRLDIATWYSQQLQGFPLSGQEVISVRSRDGKYTVESVLVQPPDFEQGKRYPLVLAYHGGPYGNFLNTYAQSYPVRLLSQEGFLCVLPNVRGSSGYTDEFGQANRYDLGGGDYRDAMDVVNHLIARGLVDTMRLGVMGGSYGGYMTNWTISQTQRFRAAVSLYGIFSWFTDWSNSFQPAFEQMYFGYNYWEKQIDGTSLWVSRAPQTYVKAITTPTLILHGTDDPYTNIANSREMYQALKDLGRTVEFVTYPRAGHGLRTEPNQYIDALERTVRWFTHHLQPAEGPR